MNSFTLALALVILATVSARPEPGVHRVTGQLVTRVYKVRIPVTKGPNNGGAVDRSGCGTPVRSVRRTQANVDKADDLLSAVGNAVNGVGQTVQNGVAPVVNGVANGIDTLGCGIKEIANEAAQALETGDIIGGVANIGTTAVKGVADTLGHVVDGVGNGLLNVVDGLAGIVRGFGK